MENKKREVTGDGDEVEDETKMEMFYSLLRSFRDARDRRRRELQELEKNESNRKKMKTTTTVKAKAEASFEWQDFTTEIHFRKPPVLFPKPVPCDTVTDKKGMRKVQQQQHQNQNHDDLDLNLNLAL